MGEVEKSHGDSSVDETNKWGLVCPKGMDRKVFDELPVQIQRDVIAQNSGLAGSGFGAGAMAADAELDAALLASLPESVRREILDQDAAERQRQIELMQQVPAQLPSKDESTPSTVQDKQGYTGEMNSAGQRHGVGELHEENGAVYKGQWWNGVKDGQGTLTMPDGSEYTGSFKLDQIRGQGTFRFTNGNVYEGNFKDGQRHGRGSCTFKSGDRFEGNWREGTMSGFGRYYYSADNKGARSGRGELSSRNSIYYEGHFHSNMMHGEGKLFYGNGEQFQGAFVNGKLHGRGTYVFRDGKRDVYKYLNGARVGDGVRWSADRKKSWRLSDGKATGKVSTQEANDIFDKCGRLHESA